MSDSCISIMIFFRKSGSLLTWTSESRNSSTLPVDKLAVSFSAFAFPMRWLLTMTFTFVASNCFIFSLNSGVGSSTVTKISFVTFWEFNSFSMPAIWSDSLYMGMKILMSNIIPRLARHTAQMVNPKTAFKLF